jgi:hypothetical protein
MDALGPSMSSGGRRNAASISTLTREKHQTTQVAAERLSSQPKRSSASATKAADSVVHDWVSPDGLNSKHLYTHGPARIFQRNFSNGDKGTLCVELSYELSERIKEKVEASRHVRALNAAAAQRSEDLLNEELRIAALQGERHRELVEFVTAIEAADRAHTDDEQAKATAMGAEIQKGNEQRRCLKDEREYLPVYMQHFRAKWVALARDVEVLEEDILLSCKLLPEFDDKTELLLGRAAYIAWLA